MATANFPYKLNIKIKSINGWQVLDNIKTWCTEVMGPEEDENLMPIRWEMLFYHGCGRFSFRDEDDMLMCKLVFSEDIVD